MAITVDATSSVPLYRQIEDWYRRAIADGSLVPGTKLPAIRQLSDELGVSRITVERAYAELMADGVVEGRGSGGTVVTDRPAVVERPRPRWQTEALSLRSGVASAPNTRGVVRSSVDDGVIDLSGGLGDPGLFDLAGFNRVLNIVRLRDGVDALDYGDPQGYGPLRQVISGILGAQGLRSPADRILVTAGSQQAITLVASCLLRPGDAVLVEGPTYNSALDLFRVLGLAVVEVPVDARGMRLDLAAEAIARHRPRLIYTMPTYQNPTGVSMDLARRRGLLELAIRHDIPILEDDFVGDLRFEGRGLPPLKALDQGGHVVYVSTFSKMLLPGLRTGYLVVDGPVFDLLAEHKRLTDLACATLIQRSLAEYVGVGRYQTHLKRSVRLYRDRRDALVAALGRHAPHLDFSVPAGGLFLWVKLGDEGRGDPVRGPSDFAARALAAGVKLAPGGPFFADPARGAAFGRLNFAAHGTDVLEEAARRLGKLC
jgi:GntR family transcriptional regulator/MocR family aminotransferase